MGAVGFGWVSEGAIKCGSWCSWIRLGARAGGCSRVWEGAVDCGRVRLSTGGFGCGWVREGAIECGWVR